MKERENCWLQPLCQLSRSILIQQHLIFRGRRRQVAKSAEKCVWLWATRDAACWRKGEARGRAEAPPPLLVLMRGSLYNANSLLQCYLRHASLWWHTSLLSVTRACVGWGIEPSMKFGLSKGRKASPMLRLFTAQKTLGCWCCATFFHHVLYVYGFMIRSPLAFDWATHSPFLCFEFPPLTLWMHKMCRLFTIYMVNGKVKKL